MNWTEEQVLALAPDAASVKAGKGQANAAKWPTMGATHDALWGEVKGSGSTPYQTRIDLRQIGYKCSCPSRKFPCKHAIGLFLLHVRSAASFSTTTPPEWVSNWIDQRAQKAEQKNEKESRPVDKVAQQKRAEKRAQKVAAGAEELQRWLKDLIRSGIANFPEQTSSFWKNTEARMVDAQAPGLASMVRLLNSLDYHAAGWEHQACDTMAKAYLVTEGLRHIEQLPSEVQHDIRTTLGWSYPQEELKQQEGITDVWSVLGKHEMKEERINVVKYWLKGEKSERYALILQFVAPGQPKSSELVPGTQVEAELVFYPGAHSLRAIIKSQQKISPLGELMGYPQLAAFQQAYATMVAAVPWVSQVPVVLSRVTPSLHRSTLWLIDEAQKGIAVSDSFYDTWKLLALSGGQPLSVSGVVENQQLYPLGVWVSSEYHILSWN